MSLYPMMSIYSLVYSLINNQHFIVNHFAPDYTTKENKTNIKTKHEQERLRSFYNISFRRSSILTYLPLLFF